MLSSYCYMLFSYSAEKKLRKVSHVLEQIAIHTRHTHTRTHRHRHRHRYRHRHRHRHRHTHTYNWTEFNCSFIDSIKGMR